MATSSFNEKFVIKNKKTLGRLNDTLKQESRFEHIKPITDDEVKRREELAKRWISSK